MRYGAIVSIIMLLASQTFTPCFAAESSLKKKIYLKQYTPGSAALKSALLPGWGQCANHQKAKGYTIGIVEGAAIASALVLFNKAESTYDDYEAKGIKTDNLYDDYKTYYTSAMIATGVACGVWIYSVVEAYIFARDEIKKQDQQSWHLNYQHGYWSLAYTRRFDMYQKACR